MNYPKYCPAIKTPRSCHHEELLGVFWSDMPGLKDGRPAIEWTFVFGESSLRPYHNPFSIYSEELLNIQRAKVGYILRIFTLYRIGSDLLTSRPTHVYIQKKAPCRGYKWTCIPISKLTVRTHDHKMYRNCYFDLYTKHNNSSNPTLTQSCGKKYADFWEIEPRSPARASYSLVQHFIHSGKE